MFIINTITSWDEPPRARHQVAYALAKKYKVVFVAKNKFGFPKIKFFKAQQNLEVLTPYFPIDTKIRLRLPFFNQLYQKWLYKLLRKKYSDVCIINFDFTASFLHRYFKNTIYYCNDDHIAISYIVNIKSIARYQEKCEATAAQNSVFCVGTSEYLAHRLIPYNKNSFEIRLGAPNLDKDYKKLFSNKNVDSRIHVGFVGFLNTVDINLLEFLFSKEEIRYTLVGPNSKSIRNRFKDYANVEMTGELKGDKLYSEVNNFDVGLIPYNINSKVDRTPNKLWLYLALGVPVVISNIPGIKNWVFPEKYVYRSESDEDFYKYIQLAHNENTKALCMDRKQFTKQNTWDKRMIDFLKYYSQFT